jgi:hypothetical protein
LKVHTGQGAATDTTTAVGKPDTNVELCTGLGISRRALYRHVTPDDEARPGGVPVLDGLRLRILGRALASAGAEACTAFGSLNRLGRSSAGRSVMFGGKVHGSFSLL